MSGNDSSPKFYEYQLTLLIMLFLLKHLFYTEIILYMRSKLVKCSSGCACVSFSNNLERNTRLDSGRYDARSSGSRFLFLSAGFIPASFKSSGKTPVSIHVLEIIKKIVAPKNYTIL